MRIYGLISIAGKDIKSLVEPVADYDLVRKEFARLQTEPGEGEMQIVECVKMRSCLLKPSKVQPVQQHEQPTKRRKNNV